MKNLFFLPIILFILLSALYFLSNSRLYYCHAGKFNLPLESSEFTSVRAMRLLFHSRLYFCRAVQFSRSFESSESLIMHQKIFFFT